MGTQRFASSAKLPSPATSLPQIAARQTSGEVAASLPQSDAKLPKQLLSAAERLRRLEEAKAFLRQHLAGGPQPARTLLKAAKSVGIAERTLHRAKDVLGVTTERAGGYAGHGQWVWYPSAEAIAVSRPTAGIAAQSR